MQINKCKMQHRLMIAAAFYLAVVLVVAKPGLADDPFAEAPPAEKPGVKQKLLERKPFDAVILAKSAGGATLEVQTISLPQRPPVTLPKGGLLKVRVLDRPTEDFEIGWASVAQVRVFEQLLMDEGLRLAAAGKFDDAYDYFGQLRNEYPNSPGLEDAISDLSATQRDRPLSSQAARSCASALALALPTKPIVCRAAE